MKATRTRAAVLPHARGVVGIESLHLGEPGPGEVLLRMEACGVCHSDLFVAGLEKLPVAPITLGPRGHRLRGGRRPGRYRMGPRRPRGYDVSGNHLRHLRVVPLRPRALLPEADQFRLHAARRAVGVRDCARLDAGAGAGRAFGCRGGPALLRWLDGIRRVAGSCAPVWPKRGAVRFRRPGPPGAPNRAHSGTTRRGCRPLRRETGTGPFRRAEITLRAADAGRTLQKEHGGVDAAIVLTASPAAVQQAFRALRRNGTLVLVGLAASSYELPLVDTVLKGVTIRGSYLGTRQDLAEVFALAVRGEIRAHIQMHALEETPAVLESLGRGEIAGRAVIGFCSQYT